MAHLKVQIYVGGTEAIFFGPVSNQIYKVFTNLKLRAPIIYDINKRQEK